jgi:cyclopropane fatty-acyl-phospholipid synthase-like methyltransferase
MLLDSVRNLLGWHAPLARAPSPPVEPPPSLVPDLALAQDDDPIWSSARISVAEALWGQGFIFPGGAEETLRLAKPLGLSPASSLLLLGAGSGGPPSCIATEWGVWVSGYEENPHLTSIANERSLQAGLGRRAQVEPWNPLTPKFSPRYYHHAVAIEPLRGARPEPSLAGVALAVKSGGQFVLTEAVADVPLEPDDPTVAVWARLEHRPADVPTELVISELLARLGFEVRIVEDISRRHLQYALAGWRDAVQAMAGVRPTVRQLSLIVREAELWMARFRLMRAGKLRLVRWHAIVRGGRPRA